MKDWHQRLTIVGLLLILAGFAFALLFSWSVGHQPRLVAHDAYQPVFEAIAGGGEWRELEEEITASSVTHRRAADVHGHSINMGILLILIGLFAPLASANGDRDYRLLAGMAAAAVVYPAGLFLQFLGLKLAGEVVSAIGAASAVAVLAALGLRLSRAVDRLARRPGAGEA